MPKSGGTRLVLAMALVLLIPGVALANGFDASVEYQGNGALDGAEVDLGTAVLVSGEGDQATPLTLESGNFEAWRYGLGYTAGRTRFGLSWLRFGTHTTAGGSLPGYFVDLSEEGFPRENRFDPAAASYGFAGLWGMDEDTYLSRGPFGWYEDAYYYLPSSCNPPRLVETEGGWDPEVAGLTWSASGDTSMESVYGTVEHTVIDGERVEVGLIGGVHYVDWTQNVNKALAAAYHEEMTDVTLRPGTDPDDFTETDYAKTHRTVGEGSLSITSTERVTYRPLGLAIGATGSWLLTNRLSLTGSVLHSYLRGDAKYSGNVTDVVEQSSAVYDTVYTSHGPVQTAMSAIAIDREVFDLPETASEQDARVTEARVGLQFDFTEAVFATLGYAWTRWNDLPTSPEWHYGPGGASGEWLTGATADLDYSRWTVGLGIRF